MATVTAWLLDRYVFRCAPRCAEDSKCAASLVGSLICCPLETLTSDAWNSGLWSTVYIYCVSWGGGSLLPVSSVLSGAPVPPYTSQVLSESCLGSWYFCVVLSMAFPCLHARRSLAHLSSSNLVLVYFREGSPSWIKLIPKISPGTNECKTRCSTLFSHPGTEALLLFFLPLPGNLVNPAIFFLFPSGKNKEIVHVLSAPWLRIWDAEWVLGPGLCCASSSLFYYFPWCS